MTTFYGLPNAEPFWHWTTLVHFALVALAGGTAFYVALRSLRKDPSAHRLAWLALAFIALDLLMLWAESPARFRLTHLWLFLSFKPSAPIWWGAWGLAASALLLLLLALGARGERPWAGLLALSSAVVLLYPGYALAVNAARPLWDHLLLALFPATGLLLALGLLAWLRPAAEVGPWLQAAALVSLTLTALYPLALRFGNAAQQAAFAQWLEGAGTFAAAAVLLAAAAVWARKNPYLAGGCAIVATVLLRSWIVEAGQHALLTHGF